MDSLPVIFDISSDDDELCCEEPEGNDYDWLSEVLKSVDASPAPGDDSDDVVMVSEGNHWKKAKLSKGFDEDCVILDGDPEKLDGIVNEPENDSDELLIVGEKGQVACRDFPHSRQHCAKFPFNSTPHENHCNLCHCYVCDSIAPCIYWGKGRADYDHCHATEKEEKWKLQRENRKQRKRALPSVPEIPYASRSTSLPQINQTRQFKQIPLLNNVQPSAIVRSACNPALQNQASRPNVILPCTSSTSNPVTQNRASRPNAILDRQEQALKPNMILPCTSLASNLVTRICRPNVIFPCSSATFKPATQNTVSWPNVILPHASSESNPIMNNQASRPSMILPCVSRPNVILPATSNPVTQNQVSIPNVILPCTSTSSASIPSIQNQASKPTVFRACNPPTNLGAPRVKSHSRGYMAHHSSGRNRVRHQLPARRAVVPVNNDFMRKEGDHSSVQSGPFPRTCQRSPFVAGSVPTDESGTFQSEDYGQPSTGNMFLSDVPSQAEIQSLGSETVYRPVDGSQSGIDQGFSAPQMQPESNPIFDFEKWLLDNEPQQEGLAVAGMLDFDLHNWFLGNDHLL